MKVFRKNQRTFSSLLLISMLFNVFQPFVASANTLTTSQQTEHQPSGGGGDIVNPMNGALQYSIPGITIPGPGLSYQISFNYNSDDVKVLNEPSCIGVGWTMTSNSITRNLVDKPDDHKGNFGLPSDEYRDYVIHRKNLKKHEKYEFTLGGLSSKELNGYETDLSEDEAANANPSDVAEGDEQYSVSTNKEMQASIYYDNYDGIGFSFSVLKETEEDFSPMEFGEKSSTKKAIKFDTQSGYTVTTGKPVLDNYVLHNKAKVSLMDLGLKSINAISPVPLARHQVSPIQTNLSTTVTEFPFQLGIDMPGNELLVTGGYDKITKEIENKKMMGSLLYKESKSRLVNPTQTLHSYGFNYRSVPTTTEGIVSDYNRIEFGFAKGTPFLPYGTPGKDIFVQSSSGAGGAFKLSSGGVENYYPNYGESNTTVNKIWGEFGLKLPQIDYQVGVDVERTKGTDRTGAITPADDVSGIVPFTNSNYSTKFVKTSEVQITPQNNKVDNWGGDYAAAFKVGKKGFINASMTTYNWSINNVNASILSNKLDNEIIAGKNYDEENTVSGGLDKKVRNTPMEVLTTEEAVLVGKSKGIGYLSTVSNDEIEARKYHFAEFTTTEHGGREFVYGEPVYNFFETTSKFSIDHERDYNPNETVVDLPDANWRVNASSADEFIPAKSDKPGGGVIRNGITKEILDETTISPFANHWLQSCILSRDYYDLTGDGFTADDQGAYVTFHYKQTHDIDAPFLYRFPYEGVSLQQGHKGEVSDDLGFVKFGAKEVKYVDEIHTKTHYAKFVYGTEVNKPRLDGYPVKNQKDGGIDVNGKNLERLDHIELYLKKPNGTDLLVETVYLEHNYELMPEAPDNIKTSDVNADREETGRLTLKKVYRTSYQSNVGENFKYEFNYGDVTSVADNPNFCYENVDAFGYFKRNLNEDGSPVNSLYPYADFPYVEDKTLTRADAAIFNDVNPAPYCLKSIKTPQGGEIIFDYEDRSYSYVENHKANYMFDIVGLDDLEDANAGNRDISNLDGFSEGYLPGTNELVIELDPDVFPETSNSTTLSQYASKFYRDYLKEVERNLYIKAYVYINSEVNYNTTSNARERERDFEFIEVPAALDKLANDPYSVFFKNGKPYGKFKIKKLIPQLKGAKTTQADASNTAQSISNFLTYNPIRFFAWEKVKARRFDVFFGKPEDNAIKLTKIITTIPTILGPTSQLITGIYGSRMRFNGWSKVRLSHPTGNKKGGGYRVKSVKFKDNWKVNGPIEEYAYKQVYDYTIEDGSTFISSGVAKEPFNGREQRPNYKLYTYMEKGAIGESTLRYISGHPLDYMGGGGGITHRKVTIHTDYSDEINRLNNLSGINISESDINLSKVGFSVYEYNTAKDYPDIKLHTRTSPQHNPIGFTIGNKKIATLSMVDKMLSQGYSHIKNGMQGTLKSIREFDRNGKDISGQTYYYRTKKITVSDLIYSNDFKSMEPKAYVVEVPDNDVVTIDSDGATHRRTVGENAEVWLNTKEDLMYSNSKTYVQFNLGIGAIYNFNGFNINIITPIDINFAKYKYVTLNKEINKVPVLESVQTIKEQSKISTEYLIYDDITASPLLTRVENEYPDKSTADPEDKEKIYKFAHPAYWEYPAFKPASQTLGNSWSFNSNVSINNSASNNLVYEVKLSQLEANSLDFGNQLKSGDKLHLSLSTGEIKVAYVHELDVASSILKLYGDGETLNADVVQIKVVQSANTNAYGVTVGELVSKDVNITGNSHNFEDIIFNGKSANGVLAQSNILNASAMTYKGEWPVKCCTGNYILENPYINGALNNWKPYQSFVYHDDRDYTAEYAHQTGIIKNFQAFSWENALADLSLLPAEWVLTSKAEQYNNHNSLIQSSNALGLHSTSVYGYGDYLLIGRASNSSTKETYVENFEQGEFNSCENSSSLDFTKDLGVNTGENNEITNTESHTGRYSIKVKGGEDNKINVTKILLDCSKQNLEE